MTDEVYELLSDAIDRSGRSMNTEINTRLLESFQESETEIDRLRRAIESQSREIQELRQAIQEELAKKNNN